MRRERTASMKRRFRRREHRSPIARAVRRARKAINHMQLGPDYVAAIVIVFGGISFAAGLAVGTSSGASVPTSHASAPQISAESADTDRNPTWLHSDDVGDSTRRSDDARGRRDMSRFDGSAALDPEHFASPDRSKPAEPEDGPVTRDSLGLEEPLLPPQK